MSTANYVNEVMTPEDRPTCHVCGGEMVPGGICDACNILHTRALGCQNWRCQSCGTTTEPS